MKVRYNKGMGYPVEISDGKTATCISLDAAKELQENLSAVIEQAENTPEEELTEFEIALENFVMKADASEQTFHEEVKQHASELLSIARKELCEQIVDHTKEAYEDGEAEALITRATELTKNLANSGMDKDSIPYHLIEFMCNLYTCRNWKEIEETAEAYVTRIKAAALKDLPRWKKCEHEMHTLTHLLIRSIDAMWIGESVKVGQYYIPTNDLILKLPGFNE